MVIAGCPWHVGKSTVTLGMSTWKKRSYSEHGFLCQLFRVLCPEQDRVLLSG